MVNLPSNPGDSLRSIAMRQFFPMNYATLETYGVAAELPADQQGTPDYIRQSGLIPFAAERKAGSADTQLYTGVYAVSRDEYKRRVHFAAALAYPFRETGDLPNEKQVQKFLAETFPHPEADTLKQVPAFKARRHEAASKVVPVPSGHISPFVLGEKFTPGARYDDPNQVQSVSEVLFVLPQPEKHGGSILLPVGRWEYLRTEMRGYFKFLLHAMTTEEGVHIVEPGVNAA